VTIAQPQHGRRLGGAQRLAATVIFVGALLVHGLLLVRGGDDPHKLFGFRPFNESDTWQAEIVRIHADGSRHALDDGTWEYDWDELVGVPKLQALGGFRHAAAGAPASIDFLERAMDWVLDNIPDDPDTVALEATVSVIHNGGPTEQVVLRSEQADGE
jgi:hypothetical protein